MIITKRQRLGAPIPLLSAFPFEIRLDRSDRTAVPASKPTCSPRGNYNTSTCIEEESVFGIFTSKRDVKRDD